MFEPLEDPEKQRQVRIENFFKRIPTATNHEERIKDLLLQPGMAVARSLVSAISEFFDPIEHTPFTKTLVKQIVKIRNDFLMADDPLATETEGDNQTEIVKAVTQGLGMVDIGHRFVVPQKYRSYVGNQENIIDRVEVNADVIHELLNDGFQVVVGVRGVRSEADHTAHVIFDQKLGIFTSVSDFRAPELIDEDIANDRIKFATVIGPLEA